MSLFLVGKSAPEILHLILKRTALRTCVIQMFYLHMQRALNRFVHSFMACTAALEKKESCIHANASSSQTENLFENEIACFPGHLNPTTHF